MKSEKTNNLMHTLIKCITACEYCATLCLKEPDAGHMARCVMLDRDCADICTLTVRFVARNSEHAKHVMKECIEICKACAEECSKHDNSHCRHCAEICRECATHCEEYLQAA